MQRWQCDPKNGDAFWLPSGREKNLFFNRILFSASWKAVFWRLPSTVTWPVNSCKRGQLTRKGKLRKTSARSGLPLQPVAARRTLSCEIHLLRWSQVISCRVSLASTMTQTRATAGFESATMWKNCAEAASSFTQDILRRNFNSLTHCKSF